MKISVLLAASAESSFRIFDTLASVGDQLHDDWELVVIDDGTAENVADQVRAFAHHVPQSVRHETLRLRRGVSALRNRLLDLARGGALAFIDAGDRWDPTHLSIAVRQFELGEDVIVADVRAFDPQTNATLRRHDVSDGLIAPRSSIATLFAHDAIPFTSAVTVRATLARAVGRFDPEFDIGEGWDFWLRTALRGARFARGQMTCHCVRRNVSAIETTRAAVRFYEKHSDLPFVPEAQRRQALARSLVALGRLTREADARRSVACLWQAWHLRPWHWQAPIQLIRSSLQTARVRHAHSIG